MARAAARPHSPGAFLGVMVRYRDTFTLAPHWSVLDLEMQERVMFELDGAIMELGVIHGHKSHDSVEWEIEAEDLWDLRESVDELLAKVSLHVDYELNKECISETL